MNQPPVSPLHGQPAQRPAGPAKIAPVPTQSVHAGEPDLSPLSLVDDPAAAAAATASSNKIRAFGPGTSQSGHSWKRQAVVTGRGACRVRSFHGRLSDEGMEYMDTKINEWLDGHPEVEVKIVTTSIGQYEGKIREPALVVNIWY